MTNKALTIEQRVELYSALAATKFIEKINNTPELKTEIFLKTEKEKYPLIEIDKIIVSRELNKKTLESEAVDNILTRYTICQSSKNIYVSIGFSRNAYFGVDFYRSIQDSGAFAESSTYHQQHSNYINKSVFKHGSRIPLRYFKQCLAQGFNIIFTGYEFGAALAAFVAIRLLLLEKEKEDTYETNRIRFIGFGCPLFVGEEFKNEIERKKLSDQFLFYRNDNDINVNFRDLQSILSISTHEWDLKVRDQNFDPVDLRAMSEGFRELFSFQRSELWNSTSVYFDKGYSKDNKLFKLYLPSLQNVASLIDNFKSDRFYVGFGQHFQFNNSIDNRQNITLTIDLVKKNMKNLIKNNHAEQVSIQDYILRDANNFANNSNNSNNSSIKNPSDEKLEKEPISFLALVKKVKAYLNDENMNDEQIYYTLVISRRKVNRKNKEVKRNKDNVKLYDVKIGVTHRYIDNIFCLFLLKYDQNNKEIRVPLKIISNDKYSAWYECVIQIENEIEIENNENDKINIGIEFNSFFNQNRIDKKEIKCNTKDDVLNKRSLIDTLGVDLIYINAIFFYYIFKILSKEDTGNKTNKERADKILKSLKQIEDSNALIRPFSIDNNEKIYIKAMFKLFGEDVDENFLRRFHWMKATSKTFESILKSVEQMKKNSNSDPMRILLEDMVPKVYYYKRSELNNYSDLLSRYVWFDVWSFYKRYSDIVKETDFGRNIWFFKVDVEGDLFYEFKSKDMYYYLEKNKDAVYVSVGEIEKFFKDFLDKYKKDNNNTGLPSDIRDIKLMNTMKCNYEIREELSKSYMVGVIGLKKAGKSKFVELLTKPEKRIASAIDETSQMRPYEFSNDLTIVDYPHYNSTNELYRVQYTYSRFLLDYVFVVVDAMQIGDSLTIDIYNILRDLRKQNCPRFCLLLNKADNLWNDGIDNEQNVKDFLEKKTKIITDSLKEVNNSVQDGFNFNNEDNFTIRLSCLVDKEINNKMGEARIITYNNFEREIVGILNKIIKPENEFRREERASNQSVQKNCVFKYERRKGVVLRVEVLLTDEKKVKDENDVNSFEVLQDLLTDYGFYDKNSMIVDSDQKEMKNFKDLLDSSETTFEIKKRP